MYHVSRRDLGEIVTLLPQIPRNKAKSECAITPRVCFAPTLEQCVIGLVGYALNKDVTILGAFYELANSQWCPTVYWTDQELFEPEWVSDFHITHEEWALGPICVERIGYIDCMEMVRRRHIVIVDEPVYVTYPDHELVSHMSEKECGLLLNALA